MVCCSSLFSFPSPPQKGWKAEVKNRLFGEGEGKRCGRPNIQTATKFRQFPRKYQEKNRSVVFRIQFAFFLGNRSVYFPGYFRTLFFAGKRTSPPSSLRWFVTVIKKGGKNHCFPMPNFSSSFRQCFHQRTEGTKIEDSNIAIRNFFMNYLVQYKTTNG